MSSWTRRTGKFVLLFAFLLPACQRSARSNDCLANDPGCNPFATALFYQFEDSSEKLMTAASLSGTGAIRTTGDGLHWKTLATPAGAATLTSVTRSGDRLIAVGGTGAPSCYIATSDDFGRSWTQRSCGTTGVNLSGVRAGNGMVVAVGPDDGGNPAIRISFDNGTTWLDPANGPAGTDFNSLAFYDGSFYASSGGVTKGVYASPDPYNLAFVPIEPVAGGYFSPRVLRDRLYAVKNGPSGLHIYDGANWTSSNNLFGNRPFDETSYTVAAGDERTVVAGGGLSAGSSTCWVDYSDDAVNFQGGGVLDSSCNAVPGEAYVVFRSISFRGLFLAYGLEAIGGTNKYLSAYSTSGLPGDWTVAIGTGVPAHNDFLRVPNDG